GHRREAGDQYLPAVAYFAQVALVGIPAHARALRTVENFSVGGKVQDLDVGKSVSPGALGHQFARGMKTTRATLAVKLDDALEIAPGGFAIHFVGERGDFGVR